MEKGQWLELDSRVHDVSESHMRKHCVAVNCASNSWVTRPAKVEVWHADGSLPPLHRRRNTSPSSLLDIPAYGQRIELDKQLTTQWIKVPLHLTKPFLNMPLSASSSLSSSFQPSSSTSSSSSPSSPSATASPPLFSQAGSGDALLAVVQRLVHALHLPPYRHLEGGGAGRKRIMVDKGWCRVESVAEVETLRRKAIDAKRMLVLVAGTATDTQTYTQSCILAPHICILAELFFFSFRRAPPLFDRFLIALAGTQATSLHCGNT